MAESQASTTINTPAGSVRPGDAPVATVGSFIERSSLPLVPEGKVAVWDDTMQQIVVKDLNDVKLKVCPADQLKPAVGAADS